MDAVWWCGFRAAVGMPSLVLFASMMGFGSLAREASLALLPTIATTIGIWGLPGQMVMVETIASGAPLFAVGLGVSIANARFLPMTLAIAPHLSNWKASLIRRLMFAQLVTLTPWVMALQRWPDMEPEDRVPFYVGYSAMCMAGAISGTVLGHELAGILPRPLTLSLVFISPAFFAMVLVGTRQRASILALILGAVAGPFLHICSPEWGLPVTGVLAGSLAFGADLLWRRYVRRKDGF